MDRFRDWLTGGVSALVWQAAAVHAQLQPQPNTPSALTASCLVNL